MNITLELVLYFLAFALLVIAGIGGVGRRAATDKTVWYARLNLPVLAAATLVFAILILPLL